MELYFDNNATTAPDEAVIEAMTRALREDFGNPSSPHGFGERAAALVAEARGEVARLVGANPREIVFTSCGTEANNTAVHVALARARGENRRLLATTAGEHASVLEPLKRESRAAGGEFELDLTPLLPSGALDLDHLHELVRTRGSELALISVQAANNETGARVPESDLAALIAAAHGAGVPVHLDAVQLPGKVPFDLAALEADLASISAHKFHGPKGVGALVVRGPFAREGMAPYLAGGAQEDDRRGGTLNVPGICGMGAAARLAREHLEGPGAAELEALRDGFEDALAAELPEALVHAAGTLRLPNTSSVRFPGVDGELLISLLADQGLAASTGAACSSEKKEPSHVLLALGCSPVQAEESLRFSLSRRTTTGDVQRAVGLIVEAVAELAPLSSRPQ